MGQQLKGLHTLSYSDCRYLGKVSSGSQMEKQKSREVRGLAREQKANRRRRLDSPLRPQFGEMLLIHSF